MKTIHIKFRSFISFFYQQIKSSMENKLKIPGIKKKNPVTAGSICLREKGPDLFHFISPRIRSSRSLGLL